MKKTISKENKKMLSLAIDIEYKIQKLIITEMAGKNIEVTNGFLIVDMIVGWMLAGYRLRWKDIGLNEEEIKKRIDFIMEMSISFIDARK